MTTTSLKHIPIISIVALAAIMFGCRSEKVPQVVIETPMGNITVEIYTDKAPVTSANFLKLTDEGVYDKGGAAFYRVVRQDNQPRNKVKIEVIQGGLDDREVAAPIPHETTAQTGLKHLDGTISMARSEPGTASSEFFICIGDQPELDFGGQRNPDGQGFAAFGRVVGGMDIVRKIQQLPDTAQYLVNPLPISAIRRKSMKQYDVTLETLLEEMVSCEANTYFPEYKCLQQSSYDRRSLSPGNSDWYANNDGSGYYRTDTIDGRTEKVLFEADGPGVITRIWLTTQDRIGVMRFYFEMMSWEEGFVDYASTIFWYGE
ncbi:MAG: peptidylprolyl isomerase [Tannerella sp.]|jgi:peptidyl-prolyl cis-trans isomerase A (cyclophilin A)|nr:peptidylprolyl isomerase [Tannerella sp.]